MRFPRLLRVAVARDDRSTQHDPYALLVWTSAISGSPASSVNSARAILFLNVIFDVVFHARSRS
jgi:hypothetical protein